MQRLFCSVPKEVGEWIKQLAVEQRTTSSEILRRIAVGIYDDQVRNAEHIVANAPYDSVGEALGGVVGDIDLIFEERTSETRIPNFPMRPFYQWLASGLPTALKRAKLFTEREKEKSVLDRLKDIKEIESGEDEADTKPDDDGWDD